MSLESTIALSSDEKKYNKLINSENKRCILLWKPDDYGLTILTMENVNFYSKWYQEPIFYIPLRTFMRCGAFWSALNLCTIFWEQRPYHIERTFQETERNKGAYLIAFASNRAPICKKWAEQCINNLYEWPCNPHGDEAFVEIIVFQNSLKDKIMDAIQIHMLDIVVSNDTFNVFETK